MTITSGHAVQAEVAGRASSPAANLVEVSPGVVLANTEQAKQLACDWIYLTEEQLEMVRARRDFREIVQYTLQECPEVALGLGLPATGSIQHASHRDYIDHDDDDDTEATPEDPESEDPTTEVDDTDKEPPCSGRGCSS